MYRCPVCKHATFTFWQYGVVSSFRSVQCSNCHTVLHQPSFRLRNLIGGSPLLLMFLPSLLHWRLDRIDNVFWSLLLFSLCVWVGLATTRLEPVAPPQESTPS